MPPRATPWVFCLMVFSAGSAGAQEVSLQEALRSAAENRPFLQAMRLEAEAAEAAIGVARSRFFPKLTLRENFSITDEPAASLFMSLNQEELQVRQDADFYNFPSTHKDFETRLTLEQPLFDPDIFYGWRRARAGAAAAIAGASWSEEQATFDAFQAYLQVQQARAASGWVRSSLNEAEEILRLSQERYEAGLGLKADLLRARVFRAEAERRMVSAENDLTIARRALGLAMGLEGAVEIAAILEPSLLAEEVNREVFQREDLQALAMLERQAELAYAQSRAAWLPRVGATATYALHDSGAPFGTDAGSWTVGAGLSWEIFSGFGRHYASRQAALQAHAVSRQNLEARRQAVFQLQEAQARADEARVLLTSAREAVGEAEESHRLMLQRFEGGLANLSDLLTAQAALDRARFDVTTAESRYLLALGNILYQRGIFSECLMGPKEGL